jgi:hypothetical protein
MFYGLFKKKIKETKEKPIVSGCAQHFILRMMNS